MFFFCFVAHFVVLFAVVAVWQFMWKTVLLQVLCVACCVRAEKRHTYSHSSSRRRRQKMHWSFDFGLFLHNYCVPCVAHTNRRYALYYARLKFMYASVATAAATTMLFFLLFLIRPGYCVCASAFANGFLIGLCHAAFALLFAVPRSCFAPVYPIPHP